MALTLAETAAPAATPLGLPAVLLLFLAGSAALVAWSRWVRPMNLALGFAVTVAMWTLSYVAMLQPGLVAGELLFAGALACVFLGGFVAGRHAPGESSGMSVGLVSATINLMVVGAFLRDEQQGGSPVRPIAYVVGLFAASALLGSVGARLGASRPSARRLPAAPALMAAVAAANILVMIVLGGLVTGYEAGLAVPDWPNSFGHNMLLYPVSEMRGGIFYEHAHRLFGMLVGATVLASATVAWRSPVDRATRWCATVLVAMVVVQGILGGLRVTGNVTSSMAPEDLAPSTGLAIVHGMLGQAVFAVALVGAFAASGALSAAAARVPAVAVRTAPRVALACLLLQLFLGASMRHLQVPPTADAGARLPAWALHGHVTVALVAFIAVFVAGIRCVRADGGPALRIAGKAVQHAVALQLLLGVAALVAVLLRRGADVPWWEVASTTSHQALGALLLGLAAALVALTGSAGRPAAVSRPT